MTITILDIIHRPVFYLKHHVSEAGFCLRLKVEPTQISPAERAILCLRTETETYSFSWAHLSRFHLEMETESSLQNAVYYMNDRTMDNVQNWDSYAINLCARILYTHYTTGKRKKFL
jgi:hypothetical protein